MENPEEILHSLEEFAKLRPKSIPRELEEYLCFVAKTGDPVYQWSVIKCLFREKLINVITEFYESCPSVSIPSCRNVDIFNYDTMKTFILEKLDTFVAAPFTVQRICELLTTPRKEYNRIDKYMRALEKNILVVSTTEPGNHRTPENGDGFINGIESDHVQDGSHDINIEEMDDGPIWTTSKIEDSYQSTSREEESLVGEKMYDDANIETEAATSQSLETVICSPPEDQTYIPVSLNNSDVDMGMAVSDEKAESEQVSSDSDAEAIPAVVQRRRTSIEPPSTEPTQETTQPMPNVDVMEPSKCPDPATAVDKPEISLLASADVQQHMPQAGDLKEDVLTEEPKEESCKVEAVSGLVRTEMAGAGDAAIAAPSQRSVEMNEQTTTTEPVEIDVTSFANSKTESVELTAEMLEEPTHVIREPSLPAPEEEEEDHEIIAQMPQAERPPADCIGQGARAVENRDNAAECANSLAVDNLVENTVITAAASDVVLVEVPELVLMDAADDVPAERSIGTPDKEDAVVAGAEEDNATDATFEQQDDPIEVEPAETPIVEDAPNEPIASTDPNN